MTADPVAVGAFPVNPSGADGCASRWRPVSGSTGTAASWALSPQGDPRRVRAAAPPSRPPGPQARPLALERPRGGRRTGTRQTGSARRRSALRPRRAKAQAESMTQLLAPAGRAHDGARQHPAEPESPKTDERADRRGRLMSLRRRCRPSRRRRAAGTRGKKITRGVGKKRAQEGGEEPAHPKLIQKQKTDVSIRHPSQCWASRTRT